MVLKLFYIFLLGLTGYIGYQVYDLYSARRSLTHIPAEYTFGAEEYDLTVVEFLDYTCPYCQNIHPVIMEAVTLDANVRFAPRPLPSRNPDGKNAAYIFYAAAKQGAAARAHNYLMGNHTNITKEKLPEIAQALELDEEKFLFDLESGDVHDQVWRNMKQFARLGGTVTPTFFAGPDIMYMASGGMPTAADFQNVFNEARGVDPSLEPAAE